MVNLNVLEQYGRVAVFCKTEDQAIQFMEAMWKQYPKQVEAAWRKGQTNWKAGSDGIYYVPRIFHDVCRDEYRHCQSSSLRWLMEHGYATVPFDVLVANYDLGEFLPEEDVESLLGMR